MSTRFRYQPALDGVRAVAVLAVIAYHFGGDLTGGFLGVDVFFVLSGFLITSLLIAEWKGSGRINLPGFWTRRARRLLPALLIVLVAVVVWAALAAQSARLPGIRGDSLWTLFYGVNWHFIASGQSYFEQFLGASPLRHAWSLAIEEQFYLVWPLVTFACLWLGKGRLRVLTGACVAGIAASSLAMAALYDPIDRSRAYYGTDTRAHGLLIGALLAIVLTTWVPKGRVVSGALQVAGIGGAVAVGAAMIVVTDMTVFTYKGGLVLFELAVAAVIAAVVQPFGTPLRAVLSLPPMRWIGQVSYGVYLWHWPVLIALDEERTGLDGWPLTFVRLAFTFGAAAASYYLFEQPIRRGDLRGITARLAAPVGVAMAALVIVVATGSGGNA
jgi:peptidoglycan/LPS O-acetylase OafA/YrhL